MPAPSEHIVKELRTMDRDLSVKWDTRQRRFMVLHKDARNITYPVMKVQYPDGSYKPLDRRTIDAMKASHRLKHKQPQEILYMIDKENEQVEQDKKKKISSTIEAITKDNWRPMMGVPLVNVGGVPSPQQPH